jgi:hypothetical protein
MVLMVAVITLLAEMLAALCTSQASADASSLDEILAVTRSGRVKVRLCNERSLQRSQCESLASAISSGSTTLVFPSEIVAGREEPAFKTLGYNCAPTGTSVAGLPLTLYDLESDRRLATAFGPFKVFDLSQLYSAWQKSVFVLASGFARDESAYAAGQVYSWVVPYAIPKDATCDGKEIGTLFVGDSGQPSTSVRHAELIIWDGTVFLVSYQSELGLGFPVYVTAYQVTSDPDEYIRRRQMLAPALAFTVERQN